MECVSSSIASSASMTRSAAVRSPSSNACVPPAIASVVSAARRITSTRSSSRCSWNDLRISVRLALGERSRGHVVSRVSSRTLPITSLPLLDSSTPVDRGSGTRTSPLVHRRATSRQHRRNSASVAWGHTDPEPLAARSPHRAGSGTDRAGVVLRRVRAWPGGQRRSVWGRELPPSRAPHPPHRARLAASPRAASSRR